MPRTTFTVLSWNTWGAMRFAEAVQFLESVRKDVDVFALQDVCSAPNSSGQTLHSGERADFMQLLQKEILPDHEGFFVPYISDIGTWDSKIDPPLSFGMATFVRRTIPVIDTGFTLIHSHPKAVLPGKGGTVPRYLAHVTLDMGSEQALTVANYHGLWTPNNPDGTSSKGDTPERLEQSKKVREVFDRFAGEKLLCGDLNLRPDTESFDLMRKNLRSPLTERNIANTRSNIHYKKAERFADYILVSPGLDVQNFEVLQAHGASDHLPLLLEIT